MVRKLNLIEMLKKEKGLFKKIQEYIFSDAKKYKYANECKERLANIIAKWILVYGPSTLGDIIYELSDEYGVQKNRIRNTFFSNNPYLKNNKLNIITIRELKQKFSDIKPDSTELPSLFRNRLPIGQLGVCYHKDHEDELEEFTKNFYEEKNLKRLANMLDSRF